MRNDYGLRCADFGTHSDVEEEIAQMLAFAETEVLTQFMEAVTDGAV